MRRSFRYPSLTVYLEQTPDWNDYANWEINRVDYDRTVEVIDRRNNKIVATINYQEFSNMVDIGSHVEKEIIECFRDEIELED